MSDWTVPEVRSRLHTLGDELGIDELHVLAEHLRRRQNRTARDATATSMSRSLARDIRLFAESHPDTTELDVAKRFGVNQGRVSEALYGRRGAR